MRDRQVFETFKLSNGMMVYYYPEEIGFATVRISLPVGHVNTGTDSIHNGAAHFLEHRITCRSKLFPVNHEFWDSVKTSGADLKAVTDLANTSIYFTASTPKTMDIFRGIMSHVFEPIIEDADLPQERLVLSNERKRLRWYPGTSELSHYMNTEWYDGQSLSLQQLFGSDEDLEAIDEAHLKKLHQHYFSKKAYVIAGGTIDIDQLMREIENIPTSDAELPENYNYRKWVRKEFHEKAFRDVARYQYRLYAFFQGLPERNILAA
ncbi:MAG: nardilysin, partial [Candidatus Paceibacter sp.]|nr:nardilysin [Candidatus Paceibacter sp.]